MAFIGVKEPVLSVSWAAHFVFLMALSLPRSQVSARLGLGLTVFVLVRSG